MKIKIKGFIYNCSDEPRFVTVGQVVVGRSLVQAPAYGHKVRDYVPTLEHIAKEKARINKETGRRPGKIDKMDNYRKFEKRVLLDDCDRFCESD